MKSNRVKLRSKFGLQLLGCLCVSLVMAACSQSPMPADEQIVSAEEEQPASVVNPSQSGKKLTELAGQASLPDNEASSTLQQDSANEKAPYIGRYHVQISCKDDFVQCSEGSAEYILTLVADGSAYRSIIYTGKLFSEKMAEDRRIRTYRRDTWSVNPGNAELVVHLEEGAKFYYQVDEQHNLILDLDRTVDLENQTNQHFFAAGYPMPTQAYRLIKDQ